MEAVLNSGGNSGTLVTKLAGILRTNSATNPLVTSPYPTRTAIFGAYQKSLKMSTGRSKGLIKFITATALMAELLAEDATGIDTTNKVGILQKSDIVSNPTTCVDTAGITGCLAPTGATLSDGTSAIDLTTATTADLATPPNLQMILAASSEIQSGISMMTSTGGLASASATFASGILNQTIGTPAGSPIFRYTLLTLGIGAE
jgi:hypothetical protein